MKRTVKQHTWKAWPVSRELNHDRKVAECEKGKIRNKEPQQAQQRRFTVQSALRKLVCTSAASTQGGKGRGGVGGWVIDAKLG